MSKRSANRVQVQSPRVPCGTFFHTRADGSYIWSEGRMLVKPLAVKPETMRLARLLQSSSTIARELVRQVTRK